MKLWIKNKNLRTRYLIDDSSEYEKAKGTKKSVITRKHRFHYCKKVQKQLKLKQNQPSGKKLKEKIDVDGTKEDCKEIIKRRSIDIKNTTKIQK